MRSTRSHTATELVNSGQTQMALPLLLANRNTARLNLPELFLSCYVTEYIDCAEMKAYKVLATMDSRSEGLERLERPSLRSIGKRWGRKGINVLTSLL